MFDTNMVVKTILFRLRFRNCFGPLKCGSDTNMVVNTFIRSKFRNIFFSMQVWTSRYKCGSENKNVGRSRLPKLQLVKEPVFVVLVSVKTLIDSITTTQKAETDTTVKNEPKQITPNGFVTASWNPAGIEYNRFSRNKSQNRILIRTGGLYRCVWGLYLRPRGWVFTSFSF